MQLRWGPFAQRSGKYLKTAWLISGAGGSLRRVDQANEQHARHLDAESRRPSVRGLRACGLGAGGYVAAGVPNDRA